MELIGDNDEIDDTDDSDNDADDDNDDDIMLTKTTMMITTTKLKGSNDPLPRSSQRGTKFKMKTSISSGCKMYSLVYLLRIGSCPIKMILPYDKDSVVSLHRLPSYYMSR